MSRIVATLLCLAVATTAARAQSRSPSPDAQTQAPDEAQPSHRPQTSDDPQPPNRTQAPDAAQPSPQQQAADEAQPSNRPRTSDEAQPSNRPRTSDEAQPSYRPQTSDETPAALRSQEPSPLPQLASKEPSSLDAVVHAPALEPPPLSAESLRLPRWHAPATKTQAQFLVATPEAVAAHKLRQAGLYLSSVGWVSLLGAGILQVWSAQIASTATQPHATGVDVLGNPVFSMQDSAQLNAQHDHVFNASVATFAVGGAMTVAGFVMFAVGQSRLAELHHRRPRDPLPPLSGY
jgi:hypothetical protein